MRKTIRIGVILLVLGLILTIFGVANNGIQSVYWDQGFHVMKRYQKTYHPRQIKSLTLSTDADVTVRRGTTAKIQIVAYRTRPTVTNDHGQLTIKSDTNTKTAGFILNDLTNRVEITVPAKTTLTSLKSTTAPADVQLENLIVTRLNLTTSHHASLNNVQTTQPLRLTGSDIQLTHVTAPRLQLNASDATVNITQSQFKHGHSTVDTSNGNMNVDHTRFDQAKLSTTSGNLHLNYNQARQLQVSTASGNLDLSHNQVTNRLIANTSDGNIHVQTSAQTGIQATTTDGNLTVFKQQQRGGSHQTLTYRPKATTQYQLTTNNGNVAVTAD